MAANGHHSSHGHGAHGGDHRQATDELSPNQHRQHAESDEHGGPGGHGAHGAMAATGTMPPSSGTGSGSACS
jgi:hypothetical protein